MRTFLDCFSCFLNLSLTIARRTGCDEATQREVLLKTAELFPDFPLDSRPPEMSIKIHNEIRKITGVDDPFAEEKALSNRTALEVAPDIRSLIRNSPSPLMTAVEFAIAGNNLDFGARNNMDILATVEEMIEDESSRIGSENPEHFQIEAFRKSLEQAGSLLYIMDNAGEIVFDMLFIELLRERYPELRITAAVRNSPIINDATLHDAQEIGLTELVKVISSGSGAAGTVMTLCTDEFLSLFRSADMVIAKGQGNFETLSDAEREVFLLFKTKCKVIADYTDSSIGDIMLIRGGRDHFDTGT